jgi:hypothetical protein
MDQARAQADAHKNRSARPLHPLYRFAELRGLEPWQRSRVVRQACALADREFPVMASCFVWLALILILAFAPPSWFYGGRTVLAVVVLGLPFVLIRRRRVHHHVRGLLQSEQQSARP